MKKVLIWDKNIKLKNAGGPAGYLWNIKQRVDEKSDSVINFYSDRIPVSLRSRYVNFLAKLIFVIIDNILRCVARKYMRLHSNYYAVGGISKKEKEVIKQYDFVHFHSISSAHAFARDIQELGVKTIITTHNPEPNIDEVAALNYSLAKIIKCFPFVRNYYIKKEIKAYETCDYIMFPVEDVIECYTEKSPLFNEFFKRDDIKQKMFYVPTCLIDNSQKKTNKREILSAHGVPVDAKVICYVGRHNEVKGYPYLKQIAELILAQCQDVYFVVGGNQENSTPLNHERWIELGWVNTQALLNEVDLFVLANQQTYFDIITLEILRAGVPLVTTATGGNKYIEKINNGGVLFIPKDNPQISAEKIISLLKGDLERIGKLNRLLFDEHFEMNCYIDDYSKEIQSLT